MNIYANRKDITMKKICSILLLPIIALCFGMTIYASHTPNGWYVIRNKNHTQPILANEFQFIEKYDCHYVDPSHGNDTAEKKLYLTFDAGYENGNIAKILDILKEENVPATFFILSHLIEKETDLVCRMANEGHTVANHTCRHHDMTKCHDEAEFLNELSRLESIYTEKTGKTMAKIYRPPEGRLSEENLKFLKSGGYKTVMWSFAYADWDNQKQPTKTEAIEKIMNNTHNGAILLLHPTSETNAAVLRDCIRKWRDMGYTFGRVEEIKR